MLSKLCQECGICCGGSLFTFLPVTPDEAARLKPWQPRIEPRRDGRLALQLPCSALGGTCCTAYEQRPARCREYVCHLGKALERKERSLESALAVVQEAKRQLATLAHELGAAAADDTRGVLARAHAFEASEPDDPRFKSVRARAREVEALLAQYFVGPDH